MHYVAECYYRLARSRLLRVAFFGGLGVLAQTVVFEIVSVWLGLLRPSLGTVLGAEFGLITNFLLNNRYSFNDREHAPLHVRLLRFHTVVAGSIFIQWLFVFTAERLTTGLWWIHIAYAAGILVGFASNYTWYRLWVWRNRQEPGA